MTSMWKAKRRTGWPPPDARYQARTGENIMGKMGKGQVWLLVILVVLGLAIFGYYFVTMSGPTPDTEKTQSEGQKAVTEGTSAMTATPNTEMAESTSNEAREQASENRKGPKKFPIPKEGDKLSRETPARSDVGAQENILKIKVGADVDPQMASNPNYCTLIDGHVYDFFDYLNHQPYVQSLHLDQSALMCFQNILNRLAANPPLPAGERVNPVNMLKNMYHLYRVLGFGYIRLIKDVLQHEQDTLELNLDIFYKWLMSGTQCPQSGLERPPFETTYLYAGYLLNTIGGRAYLFRRTPSVRLLASYYAILIVHRAEKEGKNAYGIDLLPYISILKEEMSNYSNLEFRKNYVARLSELEKFYRKKR